MINSKSITLYSVAWGDQVEPTKKVLEHCNKVFPYFDSIKLNERIDNLLDFNTFMIEGLTEDIDTDFVFLVQADGYIINPSLWEDEFLKYDYIGAPWPWYKVVGNAGCCIKSKKFIDLASKLKYDPTHHEYPLCPEDYFVCIKNRKYFISNGCKFADPYTGLRFSFEHPLVEFPKHRIYNSFGFHGKHNLK